MRKDRKKSLRCCGWLLASLLFGMAGLTGCKDREAEFLKAEVQEADVQAEYEQEIEVQEAEARKTEVQDAAQEMGMEVGEEDSSEKEPARIFVDVCGAVANPGVYELEEGSRIFQAVEAAGGYLPEAAEYYLNRAKSLSDGQQIYVPTKTELEEAKENGGNPVFAAAPEAEAEEAGNSQGADSASGNFSGEGTSNRVNLNTADESQLTTLTGIGNSKAKAIIAYREANGGFSSIEEIMNVEGIKEGTFARIKDEIEVG